MTDETGWEPITAGHWLNSPPTGGPPARDPDSLVSHYQRTSVEATPEENDPRRGSVSILVGTSRNHSHGFTLSAANARVLRDQLDAHLKGRE